MSKKKFITLTIIAALIVGMILAGGLFNLIDIIIVRPIVNLLFMIYNLVGDFGLAIIIFTVLVKLLTIPLTKKQLHQTRLMRKIQPELAKIRKNCNGNKQLESLQTMDLYKRYNVKPFRSVLTLFIQLPIFIAIFGAIRVIATPLPSDNLSNRAYDIVAYDGSIIKELKEKQEPYLLDLTNPDIPSEQKTAYDYHPQLFGKVNLEAKASDLLKGFSWSALFMMICSVAAAVVQYLVARQQMPSGKAEKQKKFRDLLKEASAGKDVDQSDISAMSTRQMSMMMPFMMFLIMFNLHGALAFYYFLSNLLTVLIQKVILKKARDDMDDMTDSTITKELKKIQEAEVINKKTGTKITRISVKDNKKKRR
jgi:YidC/Oxa1 family membrane protein insertase